MKSLIIAYLIAFITGTRLESQSQIDVQNLIFGDGKKDDKQVRVIAFKNDKGNYAGINCAS